MGATKRMIYIREENIDFYDKLENKSGFINEALELARLGGVENLKVTEVGETESSNTGDLQDSVESMEQRDARRLKEYREAKGLPDPTKSV